MKNKHYTSQKKGFIAAATLILMMASLGIVLAMLYRSAQGNVIASKLKKSDLSYQQSDSSAEVVLQKLRNINVGESQVFYKQTNTGLCPTPGGSWDGCEFINLKDEKISENIDAAFLCDSTLNIPKATCYYFDDTTEELKPISVGLDHTSSYTVKDIAAVSATPLGVVRAVQVPVQSRLATPAVTLRLNVVDVTVTMSWTADVINTSPYTDGVDTIEVRRAKLTSSCTGDVATLLADEDCDWKSVEKDINKSTTTFTDTSVTIDTDKYAYTLKVTNKNPLQLDSLYVTPVKTL